MIAARPFPVDLSTKNHCRSRRIQGFDARRREDDRPGGEDEGTEQEEKVNRIFIKPANGCSDARPSQMFDHGQEDTT